MIFIKSYNEKKKEEYFLEVDIQYPEKWHELHNDLLFLTERMKIEKAKKLFAKLHYENKYVIHVINLKQESLSP